MRFLMKRSKTTPFNLIKRLAHPFGRYIPLAATALVCLMTIASPSLAQAPNASNYPNRSIRLIVPFVPGGVADTGGRLIADALSKRTNQQVIVENKPGASGNIGTTYVANAEPDGYTILLGFDGTLVINPHVFTKMTFDSVKDFAPIGKIGDAATILVANPKVPVKTLMDVINLSKS
jgi:tripartite-type tricarboxylate transporter receptor subunit TctC